MFSSIKVSHFFKYPVYMVVVFACNVMIRMVNSWLFCSSSNLKLKKLGFMVRCDIY